MDNFQPLDSPPSVPLLRPTSPCLVSLQMEERFAAPLQKLQFCPLHLVVSLVAAIQFLHFPVHVYGYREHNKSFD